MLNKEICHRDIKPANVLKIKDDYFLADFGESEALDERELRINEYGTQQIEDFIKGTPRYLAPVIREQFLDKKKMYFEFHHDLFKSDIYSMGLVFLESLLMKEGFTDTQRITKILTSPQIAERMASLNSLNRLIFGGEKALMLFDGSFQEATFPNLLEEMLRIREDDRINAAKMAMLINAEDVIMNAKIEDPFPLLFKPLVSKIVEEQVELQYPLRQILYQGAYERKDATNIVRQGPGKMVKIINNKPTLLLQSDWKSDLPATTRGRPATLKLFGSRFYYEGDVVQCTLEGQGEVYLQQGETRIPLDRGRIVCNQFLHWYRNIRRVNYCLQIYSDKH